MKPQLSDQEAQQLWHDNIRFDGDTLFEKLDNALCSIHTRVSCIKCGNRVRPRDTVCDMCPECASAELKSLRVRAAK